jgi:hypothetical protein
MKRGAAQSMKIKKVTPYKCDSRCAYCGKLVQAFGKGVVLILLDSKRPTTEICYEPVCLDCATERSEKAKPLLAALRKGAPSKFTLGIVKRERKRIADLPVLPSSLSEKLQRT